MSRKHEDCGILEIKSPVLNVFGSFSFCRCVPFRLSTHRTLRVCSPRLRVHSTSSLAFLVPQALAWVLSVPISTLVSSSAISFVRRRVFPTGISGYDVVGPAFQEGPPPLLGPLARLSKRTSLHLKCGRWGRGQITQPLFLKTCDLVTLHTGNIIPSCELAGVAPRLGHDEQWLCEDRRLASTALGQAHIHL